MRCHVVNRSLDSMVTLIYSHPLCYNCRIFQSQFIHFPSIDNIVFTVAFLEYFTFHSPIHIAIECVFVFIAVVQFKIIIVVSITILAVRTIFTVEKKITVVGSII